MKRNLWPVITIVTFLAGLAAGHYYKRETVAVHVTGDVYQPGIYELPTPARVYDALQAAGGALVSQAYYKVRLYATYGERNGEFQSHDLPITGLLEEGACLSVEGVISGGLSRPALRFSPTPDFLLKQGLARKKVEKYIIGEGYVEEYKLPQELGE
ncbi:MAG: SLBB domain-containing protein [Armatimonadetes bacterium]|nr:SLBB domain-containing protein [Armatimonadota bacterium]